MCSAVERPQPAAVQIITRPFQDTTAHHERQRDSAEILGEPQQAHFL